MEKLSPEEIVKLIEKYDFEWSWYSDYPPTGFWKNDFLVKDYKDALNKLVLKKNHPLALYFHFPYCPKRCFFCVCANDLTNDSKKVDIYLKSQFKEIELIYDFFKKNDYKSNIKLIHLGGGSPSFMNESQIKSLIEKIELLVDINELQEFSIEVDPRTVNEEKLFYYSKLGINRISLGIQDFNPEVQGAINRVQSKEMVRELLSPRVREAFKSINFDLIYGLPYQTRDSFKETIEEVIKFSPDRISTGFLFYNPGLLKHQQVMDSSKIPSFRDKNLMFIDAIKRFTEEGYVMIGIGHFAKPEDSLALAFKNKSLGRSQMGYTPGVAEDFIGFGPWAMGRILNYNYQNTHSVSEYMNLLDNEKFPVFRGYILNKDELIRRDVIKDIICFASLDYSKIEEKYGIIFKDYFEKELEKLDFFVREGMLIKKPNGFFLTDLGKFFQRHICTCFDKFFKGGEEYKHSREISNGKTANLAYKNL